MKLIFNPALLLLPFALAGCNKPQDFREEGTEKPTTERAAQEGVGMLIRGKTVSYTSHPTAYLMSIHFTDGSVLSMQVSDGLQVLLNQPPKPEPTQPEQ